MPARRDVPGPDVAGDGRGVVLAPLVLAALLVVVEHQPAVPAEADVLGRGAEDHDGTPSGDGHLVELGLGAGGEQAARGRVETGRAEVEVLVVGREGEGRLGGRVEGQAPGRSAGRGHDEDVEVPEAVAREGDPLAVVAPHGGRVVGFVRGQRDGRAAGRRNAEEVSLVGEDDRPAVGREGRVTQPGRRRGGILGGGRDGGRGRRGR